MTMEDFLRVTIKLCDSLVDKLNLSTHLHKYVLNYTICYLTQLIPTTEPSGMKKDSTGQKSWATPKYDYIPKIPEAHGRNDCWYSTRKARRVEVENSCLSACQAEVVRRLERLLSIFS
jgi:hypothetical protein